MRFKQIWTGYFWLFGSWNNIYFRTPCANCVPDSEDTQIRRNGQSDSRPISRLATKFRFARDRGKRILVMLSWKLLCGARPALLIQYSALTSCAESMKD